MGQPGQGMSAQEMDRSHEGNATMQALEHEQMLRQQMELHPLNTENSQGEEDGKGSKFKPIDIERLSPKCVLFDPCQAVWSTWAVWKRAVRIFVL